MKKINWIMRDWRKNEAIEMDPKTIDLLWEMHTELGSQRADPHHLRLSLATSTNEHAAPDRRRAGQAEPAHHRQGDRRHLPRRAAEAAALVGRHPRSAAASATTRPRAFRSCTSTPARVRAWPRLPRNELALLFPNGRTKHQPADGGSISKDDVRAAQAKHPELATQIADFLDYRTKPHMPMLVADASGNIRSTVGGSTQVASATPEPLLHPSSRSRSRSRSHRQSCRRRPRRSRRPCSCPHLGWSSVRQS